MSVPSESSTHHHRHPGEAPEWYRSGGKLRCRLCERWRRRAENMTPEALEKRRASRRAADHSDAGVERRRQYWGSEVGSSIRRRYRSSPLGRLTKAIHSIREKRAAKLARLAELEGELE